MAQMYQEVVAVTISKLVADRDTEVSPITNEELLRSIEALIEESCSGSIVVEAAKIDNE